MKLKEEKIENFELDDVLCVIENCTEPATYRKYTDYGYIFLCKMHKDIEDLKELKTNE
jgi:hypothetical protein